MLALGLRAQRGGVVAVLLGEPASGPMLRHAGLIASGDPAMPASLAPVAAACALRSAAVAGEPTAAARALLSAAMAQQAARLEQALAALLADCGEPVAVALIANRATWIEDLLGHAWGWADHVPVVEALAVRAATRSAVLAAGWPLLEPDEKTLGTALGRQLMLADTAAAAMAKALGAGQRPWGQPQQRAALAAWLTLCQPASA